MVGEQFGFAHSYVPATGPDTATTLLLLHGGGGNETDLLPFSRAVGGDRRVVSPRGPIDEDGLAYFYNRPGAVSVGRDELWSRAGEVADFARTAARVYGFRPDRVVAIGYASGADLVAALLLGGEAALAGAILLHPSARPVRAVLPDLGGRPVLLTAGRADDVTRHRMSVELAAALRSAGADLTTRWHGDWRGLSGADIRQSRSWLDGRFPPWAWRERPPPGATDRAP